MIAPRRAATDRKSPASRTGQKPSNVQKVGPRADRRVRRTQRQLRDALVSLILERGWDAVTVSDVCAHADVGRSTFYVHFADKESLLLSGFDELHAELVENTRGATRPFAFAEPLLVHAQANERLFGAVVGRQSGQQVQWRFRDVLVTLLGQEPALLKLPAASRASTARFLAGGFLEQLAELLESPARANPELIAARFRRLGLAVVEVARAAGG